MFLPSEIIRKKKIGDELSREEIFWIVDSFSKSVLPDYQMSAWAMAVWFRGMSDREIADFTLAMKNSGRTFNFKNIKGPRIDKHSTGGVGDKTSLIIGPIMAAAQIHVPMIAGRGLGHTGGTLDKLLSIPGFRTSLSWDEFESFVTQNHFALMGQTEDICPADKKLYALRDVTSTVDSLPLICGSIMSKKLAEDLTGLVLDVKFGSGAFMKSVEAARELALLLKKTGEQNGLKVTAVLSNMNEPLGRYSGNSLEVIECLDILRGEKHIHNQTDFYEPTRELSLILSAHMLLLAERYSDFAQAYTYAKNLLDSGKAYEEFVAFVRRQGPGDLEKIPRPTKSQVFVASKSGYLNSLNTEKLGLACVTLGAGRRTTQDIIDPTAGIESLCRLNTYVEKDQPLFRLFPSANKSSDEALALLEESIQVSEEINVQSLPLVVDVL